MTPRTFLSIFLLSLIFPAQEIWQLWKNDNRNVNWWITLDYPLGVQWYVKFAGSKLSELLKAIVIYRITFKIQSLRMAAIVLLIYTLVDFIMFFICFNQASYTLIYTTVGAVSLVVIYWRGVVKMFHNYLKKQEHAI